MGVALIGFTILLLAAGYTHELIHQRIFKYAKTDSVIEPTIDGLQTRPLNEPKELNNLYLAHSINDSIMQLEPFLILLTIGTITQIYLLSRVLEISLKREETQ